ncbi:MAG: hypothetical protein F9K40_12675 [Kofleriaceae bacterium]|nr:MAG: hypothetical protein F9K40_12675 [Kofleriaceae bacterium]MBZ0238086.1 hypothetical protein [Kofleriaceae bacterium]
MRKNLALAVTAAVSLALAGASPSIARAEGCDQQQEGETGKGGKNFHVEYRNGQKVHVIDTVIAVCGKVPRPSVVYVLQAKNINYEWESLKQDFLPLIIATISKAPF